MLKDIQYKAIEIMVTESYKTQAELAEKVGVCTKTLFRWQQDLEFQEEHHKAIMGQLKAATDEALKTVKDSMKSKNDQVKLLAAKDILDRGGLKQNNKIELTGKDGGAIQMDINKYTDEEIDKMLKDLGYKKDPS